MASFLTALGSIADQYGQAKNAANEEKLAQANKEREFSMRQKQLGLETQAGERAERQLKAELARGKYLDMNLPTFTKAGARYKTFYNTEAGKFEPVQIGQVTGDPVGALKKAMAILSPEGQALVQSTYESEMTSTGGDEGKATEKASALVDKLVESKMAADAAKERSEANRQAAFDRQTRSLKAAKERQQSGFTEREKLNKGVTDAYSQAVDSDIRVSRMVQDISEATNNPNGAGAFDMDLLAQHIALTMGSIKGGVRSKAMIDEHRNAVALMERVKRAIDSGVRGAQLSPEQRLNFLHLARTVSQGNREKYESIRSEIQGAGPEQESTEQFDLQPEQE